MSKGAPTVRQWLQDMWAGRLRSPRAIYRAAVAENVGPVDTFERLFEEPKDGFRWEAPQRLKAPGFLLTEQHIRQWDKADWQHVPLLLQRWAAVYIELARKRGIPLYVHSAFRTEEEQRELVARGVSRTPYPRSAHNMGEAVDIVHGVYHWTMTKQEWSLLGVLGKRALDLVNAPLRKDQRLQLSWGGDWQSFYDPAHWEVLDYRARVRRLPVGPPVRYTPRAILRRV